MSIIRGFIGVVFVQLLVLCTSGSRIVLETNLASFLPLMTKSLVIRCALEDSPSIGIVGRSIAKRQQSQTGNTIVVPIHDDVSFVSSLIVLKDGVDISSVSEHIPAQTLVEAANLAVKGSITGTAGERAFLELTLDHPNTSQSGNYTCKVSGIDSVGHSVTASGSIDVKASTPTIDDVVSAMYANEIQHNAEVAKLKADNKADVAQLGAEYKFAVANLTTELRAQRDEVTTISTQMITVFHVESGIVDCGTVASRPIYVDRYTAFKTPYASSPMIHAALLDATFYEDRTAGFKINVTTVATGGFTVRCSSDSRGYTAGKLRVAWMSVPEA